MEQVHIESFRDLMGGHKSGKIICAVHNQVVRTLTVEGDDVKIVCGDGSQITVKLDTAITYQAWFMDRGSLLFDNDKKICTELDCIVFDDEPEKRFRIVPFRGQQETAFSA